MPLVLRFARLSDVIPNPTIWAGTLLGLGMMPGTLSVVFFQAEDGIRDHCVTGVQACALPIWGEFYHHFALEEPRPLAGLGDRERRHDPVVVLGPGPRLLEGEVVVELAPLAVPGQIGRASCRERV